MLVRAMSMRATTQLTIAMQKNLKTAIRISKYLRKNFIWRRVAFLKFIVRSNSDVMMSCLVVATVLEVVG